jgi:hypothetical protein
MLQPFFERGVDDRIRLGSRSSSNANPSRSKRASASSASRSVIPNTKSTVLYVPMETVGSPFSTL